MTLFVVHGRPPALGGPAVTGCDPSGRLRRLSLWVFYVLRGRRSGSTPRVFLDALAMSPEVFYKDSTATVEARSSSSSSYGFSTLPSRTIVRPMNPSHHYEPPGPGLQGTRRAEPSLALPAARNADPLASKWPRTVLCSSKTSAPTVVDTST